MATEKAQYISKYLALKLIDKASYSKEVDGKVVVVPGKSIQFNEGTYETDDPNEIKFLDSHPNCGTVFIRVQEVRNLKKAREDQFQDLETREVKLKAKEERLKAKEERLARKEKALKKKESSAAKKGNKEKTSQKEKPAF